MSGIYLVKIGRSVDVIKNGEMSFGKNPSNFEHSMTLQIYADSISEVYRKVSEEYSKYDIISIDKL